MTGLNTIQREYNKLNHNNRNLVCGFTGKITDLDVKNVNEN